MITGKTKDFQMCILLLTNSVYANRYTKNQKGERKMDKQEKKQQTNEEKGWQYGCCDFTSEETQKMFRMMPFSFDRFGNPFSYRSMTSRMKCCSESK
jgi:hypothetical protein